MVSSASFGLGVVSHPLEEDREGAEGYVGRSFDVQTAHFKIMDLWVYRYMW